MVWRRKPNVTDSLYLGLPIRLHTEALVEVVPIAIIDRRYRSIAIKQCINAKRQLTYELNELTAIRSIGSYAIHQCPELAAHAVPILRMERSHELRRKVVVRNWLPRVEVRRKGRIQRPSARSRRSCHVRTKTRRPAPHVQPPSPSDSVASPRRESTQLGTN